MNIADAISSALACGLSGGPLAYVRALRRFARPENQAAAANTQSVIDAVPVPAPHDVERDLLDRLFPNTLDDPLDDATNVWRCLERTRLAGLAKLTAAAGQLFATSPLKDADLHALARRGNLDGADLATVAQWANGSLAKCLLQLSAKRTSATTTKNTGDSDLAHAVALLETDATRATFLRIRAATVRGGAVDRNPLSHAHQALAGEPLPAMETVAQPKLLVNLSGIRIKKPASDLPTFAGWLATALGNPLLSPIWLHSRDWIENPPAAQFHDRDSAVMALLASPPPAQMAGCRLLFKSIRECWANDGTVPWKRIDKLIGCLTRLKELPAAELLDLCLEGLLTSTPVRRQCLKDRVRVLLEVEPAAAEFSAVAGELKAVLPSLS